MEKQSVGIIGHTGRLGGLILRELIGGSIPFVSGLHFNRSSTHSLEDVFLRNDIVVEASSGSFVPEILKTAFLGKSPLIICATGWNKERYSNLLNDLSQRIPVIIGSNASRGSLLQARCVSQLAETLGEDFDIDISEKHHRNKSDDLSGTAYELASVMQQAKKEKFGHDYKVNTLNTGERADKVINIRSFRSGNIFGEHEVSFIGKDEMITVKHVAFNRRAFSLGIMNLLSILRERTVPPGSYAFEDFY
ncbi:MAG: dihydrodipicolinate reductase C-terminal domain-containing protein [Victivallaceae bacterium]